MRQIKEILEDLKAVVGSNIPADMERFEQLKHELEQRELTDEEKAMASEWYHSGMAEVKEDIQNLMERFR